MKPHDVHSRIGLAALVIGLWGLGGCIEYRIETTLSADGSGSRSEEVEVDENEDEEPKVAGQRFVELMNVGEAGGWTYRLRARDDDSVHIFTRETRVADLDAWADVAGSVHIAGATRSNADAQVGYVRLGDVHFWNDVSVDRVRTADGTSYTYRETFYWVNALDALVEFLMMQVRETLESRYPNLPPEQLGEIVGTARGQLWAALDQGLLEADGDESEETLRSAIDRTATVVAKIASRSAPEADVEAFRTMLEDLYNDEEDRLGDFLSEKLPGFDLGPGFVFRLTMPGRVVSSNADERDGQTLVWKFNAGDGLNEPVEIVAESVVSR